MEKQNEMMTFVKDRVLGHNPAAALYTASSYDKEKLSGVYNNES